MNIKNMVMATVLGLGFSLQAQAGPFILAGTDADDHGRVTGGVNQLGWLFMQRALENLTTSAELNNGFLNVVNLGSDPTREAGRAAASAFGLSSLAATWSFTNIDGDSEISDFFAGTGAVNVNNTGIIMMDSGRNVSGGSSVTERNLFTANASVIDNFLGNGGGLFSQSNGYGWVTALLPTLTIVGGGGSGANLTPDGNAAFPGLTNADLTGGPRHNRFDNVGALPILAVDNSNIPVIIGSVGGSVTNPDPVPGPSPVPEPSILALLGIAIAGIGFTRRKKTVA